LLLGLEHRAAVDGMVTTPAVEMSVGTAF